MALPGLGDDIPEVEEQDEVIRDLNPSTEWRFEVAWTETIDVKLISGNAEIFGTELAPQHGYRFRGVKGAIYTETGCRLVTRGLLQSDYIFEDTTMVQYQNLHFALQKIRDQGERGPNVLIMGSADSGKTSLAKLLTAYSLRSSDGGILSVNVDPKNGMLAPPGTLSATVVESIVDPETVSGWGSAPSNGPMPVPVKLPLVYYYGFENPSMDEAGYKSLISKLALSVNGRIAEEASVRRAGVIIDSPSGLGVGNLSGLAEHVISEFSVTVIVVIGNERLYGDMTRRFPSLQIVKVDKSGGTVEKDIAYSRRAREEEVHEYFYGDSRVSLNPHSSTMEWSGLAIFKITASGSTAVDTSFLPGGGADIRVDEKSVLESVVEPTPELQGAILAVVSSDTSAIPYDIRSAPVIGFVHVSQVDDLKKRLKVLTPMSGRLPRKTLLWGTWPEHMEMDNTSLR